VLLVGFEPEEESPIVFLRLRKAVRRGNAKVFTVAPFLSRGAVKLRAALVPSLPAGEGTVLGSLDAAVLEALRGPGAVILAGERLASSPGAYSAAAALAAATGARLAWVPRRAGERGAIDSGTLPTLLPGGRLVSDAAARAEVEAAWGAPVPTAPGRDALAILQAAADGALAALVVGSVDPLDFPDPVLAERALERAGFVVSLELRQSAVTDFADVVFPVAAPVEKAGRYVDWEGRRRPFDLTLRTGTITDAEVLDALADELDVRLGVRTVPAVREEILRLGLAGSRPAAPAVRPVEAPIPGAGQALLATWHELIDGGRMMDGDPNLAGTAKPPRAILGPVTAAEVGVVEGGQIAVGTDTGTLVLPVEIADVPDRVVWVPTNPAGTPSRAVRATLRATTGAVVRLSNASAPPVVGVAETGGVS
jgi:NADH-quinone oxidoreductase subunit G